MTIVTTVPYDPGTVMERAQAGIVAGRKSSSPLALYYFTAAASAIGMVIAASIEMFTLSIALSAKFEAMSNGQDLGAQLQPMRIGILGVLLLSHLVIHDHAHDGSQGIRQLLQRWRLLPIIAIVAGMGIFMATTTAEAAGGDGAHFSLSGATLGLACGCLFTVSFLACNKLVSLFLPAFRAILTGRAQREALAADEQLLNDADACLAEITALESDIAKRALPDALIELAATEAAAAVGQVAAEAHDAYVSREALEGQEFGPADELNVNPDTSLDALRERADYLKKFTVDFFRECLARRV